MASTVGFDLLDEDFGSDVERAVNAAQKVGAVFACGEMLWPQKLDEIARDRRTANRCRIAGTERENA